MRFLAIAVVFVALAACSSHPPRTGGGGGTGAPADAGPSAPPDAGANARLTRSDCDALVGHVLEVGLAEMRARKPADEVPTDEQVAELRAKLSAEMMDMCLAWDRPSYDCMMAAPTTAALDTCASQVPAEH